MLLLGVLAAFLIELGHDHDVVLPEDVPTAPVVDTRTNSSHAVDTFH